MDAHLLSSDQPISPYKRTKNPKKFNQTFNSRSTENFAPSNILIHHGNGREGLLIAPSSPFLSSSLPSSISIFNQKQQQPPLLPLPISNPYSSSPLPTRNFKIPISSTPPSNKKNPNFTPKKPKSSKKQESSKSVTKAKSNESTHRLGPEPSDLPKEVSGGLKSVTETSSIEDKNGGEEEIWGSIFSLAPPPSSLPLPKFSLKPKLSCNVEAGGIDDGATDNLRRLLRLR